MVPPHPVFQLMSKPSEPSVRQHQSHPEETEEELREHQALSAQEGGLPRGISIKQEPQEIQEIQEEALQRERQVEQEILFRQVGADGAGQGSMCVCCGHLCRLPPCGLAL